MQRKVKTFVNLIQGKSMRNQIFHCECSAENQIRRLSLKIDRCAVGTGQNSLIFADVRAGQFDSFLIGSLCKKNDFGPGAGRPDSFFHQTGSRSRNKHQIGAPAVTHLSGQCRDVMGPRVYGDIGAKTLR